MLETVARVPYFAYLSVLHLRESLGERSAAMTAQMNQHYAEADNELHHLLIVEALGGGRRARDRAFAGALAVAYYWCARARARRGVSRARALARARDAHNAPPPSLRRRYVVVVYALSPRCAYHLSELIEQHAYETYDAFLAERADELRARPVPDVARRYYEAEDAALWSLVCAEGCAALRPRLESLYDVFVNVRDDERAHWGTLCALVQYDALEEPEGAEIRSTEAAPPADGRGFKP